MSVELRAEDFDQDAASDIYFAGCEFAGAIEDICHHHIGDWGCWDCYGTVPEELVRLREVLDQMQKAIRTTRAHLAAVERRARRQADRKAGGR
jgi:hypothetical protein